MNNSHEITSIHVGEYFINEYHDKNESPTIMKILKLAYFTQGFHLALQDCPFFKDEIQAWKHGPVANKLYWYLKKNRMEKGDYRIREKSNEYTDVNNQFQNHGRDILNVVFKKYTKLTSWRLSEITHAKDSPWYQVYNKKPYDIISVNIIREYFKNIIDRQSFIIRLYEN